MENHWNLMQNIVSLLWQTTIKENEMDLCNYISGWQIHVLFSFIKILKCSYFKTLRSTAELPCDHNQILQAILTIPIQWSFSFHFQYALNFYIPNMPIMFRKLFWIFVKKNRIKAKSSVFFYQTNNLNKFRPSPNSLLPCSSILNTVPPFFLSIFASIRVICTLHFHRQLPLHYFSFSVFSVLWINYCRWLTKLVTKPNRFVVFYIWNPMHCNKSRVLQQ